ncbi:MAG: hypothetical protein OEU51_04985 [Gammaproteobacteria bacterium]|nr:hypothetical protein [Gammaproteobacteria bacterium]
MKSPARHRREFERGVFMALHASRQHRIIRRGLRGDYAHMVNGTILKPGYAGRVLFPGTLAP